MKPVSQYDENLMISTLTLKQIFLSHIKFHPSTHDFGETMKKKTSEIFQVKQIIVFMVG